MVPHIVNSQLTPPHLWPGALPVFELIHRPVGLIQSVCNPDTCTHSISTPPSFSQNVELTRVFCRKRSRELDSRTRSAFIIHFVSCSTLYHRAGQDCLPPPGPVISRWAQPMYISVPLYQGRMFRCSARMRYLPGGVVFGMEKFIY